MKYVSAAKEASKAVTGAARGRVTQVLCTNDSASTVYLQIFDLAAVPADAVAADIATIAVGAGSTVGWQANGRGSEFVNGLSVCISSTAQPKTVAGNDAIFMVDYTLEARQGAV